MALLQFRRYSLRSKLITAFLPVALIPLGVLGFLNERATRRMLINQANERLFGAATQTAISIDSFIRANLDAIRTEAQLPTLVDYLSLPAAKRHNSATESEATATLHALSRKDPLNILSYALLDYRGRVVMDTFTVDMGTAKSDRYDFQVPLRTGLPHVSPIQFSPLAPGQASLHFSSPIRDQHGATVGLLTTRYNAAVLQQLMIQTNGRAGKQSFAMLLDDHHVYLAHGTAPDLLFKSVEPRHPDRVAERQTAGRWPGRSAADLSTNSTAFEQGLATVERDGPYFTTRLTATGDVLTSVAVTSLETQPWRVVFAQPQEVFLAPIEAHTVDILRLAAVIAGGVAGAAVLLAHAFTVPVIRLTKAAESVAAGDLTVQATVASHDEVGQLAAAFNSMTLQLRQLIEGLQQRIAERERAEQALQQAHDALESRVAERTVELRHANTQLQAEIAERKRTAVALQASEAQFRSMLDTAPDAVVTVGSDGHMMLVNAHSETMFGYTREEMLGKSIELLVPEPWREAHVRHRVAYVRKPYRRTIDVGVVITGRRKDGSTFPAEISLSPLETEAGLLITSIIRDITERQVLENQLRQSQKMEAIGTLAGGIAHEFNNTLSAILGFTDLTQRQVPRDSSLWFSLQEVLKAGARAKDLVQQIIAFSHPSEQDREPVQLSVVVQETLKLIRASLPTTIEIRQRIAPESGTVFANTTQMHQVVMNLCANAEYVMREQGGVLEIGVDTLEVVASFAARYPDLQPGPHVRLWLRDTGPGMPPDVIERIFEPFFTTKGVGEGTGMGLAIVHGIVTSHDGVIAVASTLGEGTTFTIYLPQIADIAVAETKQVEEDVPHGKGCILFVDDEALLARLAERMLEPLGYDVVSLTSSLKAVESFQAEPHRFDLVITDQTMPHMTGERLARELRRIRPDIPIILCTGYSPLINAESAQALGIDAFCMKPLVTRDLAVTIHQVLAQRAERET